MSKKMSATDRAVRRFARKNPTPLPPGEFSAAHARKVGAVLGAVAFPPGRQGGRERERRARRIKEQA